MIPALQLVYWQWLSLTLAAPVVVWGGLPFYRAAWSNLRHGAATMDTLVSIGALSAFGWSLYALFLGGAGLPGFFHPFHLTLSWSGGSSQIYLEVAAGVVTFVLAGRYAEATARRRSGAALRALLTLAAKEAVVLRDGREVRVPADQLAGRGPVRGPPGREGRRRRGGPGGRLRARPEHDQRRAAAGGRRPRAPRSAAVAWPSTGGWSCGPPGSARTPGWPRWPRWSRRRRPARRRRSGWPTGCPGCSCRWCSPWPRPPGGSGSGPGPARRWRWTPRPRCSSWPARARSGWPRPTALLVGTGRGAQLGILITGPEVLESTRRIDTILLDKTGTITRGEMSVTDVVLADGEDLDTVLARGRRAGGRLPASGGRGHHPARRRPARCACPPLARRSRWTGWACAAWSTAARC